jgi:hypothetical protein
VRDRTLRWIGVVVYLTSYFLPSIGNPDQQPMRSMPGWACAFFSIWFGFGGLFANLTPEGRRTFLSLLLPGLTNPLFLLYLLLILRRKAQRTRRVLAVLIAIFAATTPVALHFLPLVPLVGYYTWLAALGITLFPELIQVALGFRAEWEKGNGTPA